MNILVTGGAGFIGKHLVNKLSKKHHITIFENFSNSNEDDISHLLNNNTIVVKGDLNNFELLKKKLGNIDLVIHLAAKIDVFESIQNPDIYYKNNVEGSLNLLRACVKTNVNNFIMASSAAIYGNPDELPLTEKTIPNPISPYGADKLAMEFYLKAFCNSYGMNGISLRFFNVYGNGQSKAYAGVITKFLQQIHNNQPLRIFGDGQNTRDYIYIEDIILGIEQSISNIKDKKGKVYNLAYGKSTSVKELAELIISLSDKKIETLYQQSRKGDIMYSEASIELAKKELNFIPKTSLRDGILNLMNGINYTGS